jgi:hypothetical protein
MAIAENKRILPKKRVLGSPDWGAGSTFSTDWTFQQLAPYIGRMKTTMARSLVQLVSEPGDLIGDPFCGCGVIAYEAAVLGRRVLAGDWNPYGVLLTQAKLQAPRTFDQALLKLNDLWSLSRTYLNRQDLRSVPLWVRKFFHRETLRNALAFRDACFDLNESFLLACLLGILHHQRPGFLSFPSSHLVPYLRDRKFPRESFPTLYEERDVHKRLVAKIARLYRQVPDIQLPDREVLEVDAREFPIRKDVQAIVTSPPYMNELDYVRDNRLRLWFVRRCLPDGLELSSRRREEHFRNLMRDVFCRLAPSVRPGGYIVLVLGDVTRRSKATAPDLITKDLFKKEFELRSFELSSEIRDLIPDIRRSRRECKGTKVETVLVYRRVSSKA